MKSFFFGSHNARVYTAGILACLFAGIVIPLADWPAAVEAGWSAVAWCATWALCLPFLFYGLTSLRKI